jgi:TonB family protein
MLWMLMAAAATQPALVAMPMTERDYPTKLIENGESGVVSVHLSVGANGQPTACKVTESSGSQALDALTCSIATRRARFVAARDAAGQATAGDYRTAIIWGSRGDVAPASEAMDLNVRKLPGGYVRPAHVQVLYGADGKPSHCEALLSSGSAAADRAVCSQLTGMVSVAPPKSGSDEPATATRSYVATLKATG